MDFEVSKYSHIGRREQNEDYAAILQIGSRLIVVVADGLGGLSFGEVASRKAVESIIKELSDKSVNEDDLLDAIESASDIIYAVQMPGKPMSTTASILWVDETEAWAGHVGDTRIYKIRDGKILYQSIDHSVAQMNVLVGKLAPDQIRRSKDRNRLIRVLGEADAPMTDTEPLDIQIGDCFLLCTDGFWEPVSEDAMLETLASANSPRDWLSRMRKIVENANDPAQDNNTAVCVWVK